MKRKCTKQRYAYESEAKSAAVLACRHLSYGWYFTAYQCRSGCRFPDGKKAWHWGHDRPRRGRRY